MGRRVRANDGRGSGSRSGEVAVFRRDRWSDEQVRDLLAQGYTPEHVARVTVRPLEWVEAQPVPQHTMIAKLTGAAPAVATPEPAKATKRKTRKTRKRAARHLTVVPSPAPEPVTSDEAPEAPASGASDDDEFMDSKQVAAVCGTSVKAIGQWRTRGVGPEFERVGRGVRYKASVVHAWQAARPAGRKGRGRRVIAK